MANADPDPDPFFKPFRKKFFKWELSEAIKIKNKEDAKNTKKEKEKIKN